MDTPVTKVIKELLKKHKISNKSNDKHEPTLGELVGKVERAFQIEENKTKTNEKLEIEKEIDWKKFHSDLKIHYVKINHDAIKDLMKKKDISIQLIGFAVLISRYCDLKNNFLVDNPEEEIEKKKKQLTISTLSKKLKLSESNVGSFIKKLKEFNVINSTIGENSFSISLNPIFFSRDFGEDFSAKNNKDFSQKAIKRKQNKINVRLYFLKKHDTNNEIINLGILFCFLTELRSTDNNINVTSKKTPKLFFRDKLKTTPIRQRNLTKMVCIEDIESCLKFYGENDVLMIVKKEAEKEIKNENDIVINPKYLLMQRKFKLSGFGEMDIDSDQHFLNSKGIEMS